MYRNASPRARAVAALLALLIASAGCHQIVIDSGKQPSPTEYHEEWNMAFAYAIFPAQVDASGYCGGNWARVETKQSFLNWLVGFLTSGIVTPMDTKVVCASSGSSSDAEATDASEPEEPSGESETNPGTE